MKRVQRILAGLMMVLILCQSVGAAGLLGDIDADGRVTAKDKMLLNRYAAGWNGYNVETRAGDIDKDGDVDTEDATMLSRYFAGYAIEGIGEKAIDATGFSVKPEITSGNTLRFTTDVSGTVYYYYLKNDVVPDKNEFIHYWNVGNFGASATVQAGMSTEIKITYTTHDYIAICVYDGERYYEPIVLLVDLETGFEQSPCYTNAQLQYIAEVPGTLYYCYTTNGSSVSSRQFREMYENTEWQYKGHTSVNVINGETDSIPVTESYREDYPYMVITMKDVDEKYYKPVIVNVDISGFVNVPYLVESAEDILLHLSTKYDGTVFYYWGNSRVAPDTLDYDELYETAEYKGKITVTANEHFSIKIADQGTINDGFVVIQFADANRCHTPVLLPNKPLDVNGFAVKPYVAVAGEVSFEPQITGTVYWYMCDTNESVSEDTFMTEYDACNDMLKGKTNVTKNSYSSVFYDSAFPYIVLMLVDGSGNNYQPMIVQDVGDGFAVAPYCDIDNKQIIFQTTGRGRVYYYHSIATGAYTETIDGFWKSYNRNTGSSTTTYGDVDTISFENINTSAYTGMMLLFVDSDNMEYHPVYVSISTESSLSSVG